MERKKKEQLTQQLPVAVVLGHAAVDLRLGVGLLDALEGDAGLGPQRLARGHVEEAGGAVPVRHARVVLALHQDQGDPGLGHVVAHRLPGYQGVHVAVHCGDLDKGFYVQLGL